MQPPLRSSSGLNSYAQWAFPQSAVLDKKDLRERVRDRRKAHDPRAARYKNQAIHQTLTVLPQLNRARTIAAYAPTSKEAGTDVILSEILQQGIKLALPRIDGGQIRFAQVKDLNRDLTVHGAFGIREPDPLHCKPIPVNEIDAFIVPGVAFDSFGSRTGYGGGFYDRLLPRKRPDATAIALAFEFQVECAIPTLDHDCSVDLIVTEKNVYHPMISTTRCPKEPDTRALAASILERGLQPGTVIALHADLGTGKTVFVKGLAAALHTREEAVSPTFVYCRHYHGTQDLFHVDAYRLDSISGPDEAFWNETLGERGIISVEWAERLGTLMPKDAVHLFGSKLDSGDRDWTLFTPLAAQQGLHGEMNAASGD